MDGLDIKIKKIDEEKVSIFLSGSLDLNTYEDLEEVFYELLDEGLKHIRVDLSNITHMSSKGFGVLLEAMATVRSREGSLLFVNPSDKARDVFEMLGAMLDACQFD